MENGPTEAGAIADLARQADAVAPFVLEDGRTFVVLPTDRKLEELTSEHDEPITLPKRIEQRIGLQTKDSLANYVIKFKNDDSVLLADIASDKIEAVIDYHAAEQAQLVQHRATLQLRKSVEWEAWAKIDGQLMEQREFARFMEENAADVAAPEGADLLEIVKDMQAIKSADFRRTVRTSGDDQAFEYTEETSATANTKSGKIEVPTKFLLSIPVYFGEANVSLYAFLRWKLETGKLLLGIQLHRPEHVRQAVFQQIVLELADRTTTEALFGTIG